jgi:hypothetical protein
VPLSTIKETKSAFNRKRKSFHQQIRLKFKEETNGMLHWSIAFYGSETWTLRKVYQKYLEIFRNVVMEKEGEDQLVRSCEK